MEITKNHNLPVGELQQKIDNLINELEKRHSNLISGAERSWNSSKDKMSFKFKAKGFKVSGEVKLFDNKIVLSGKLPFAARMFKSKIINTINEGLKNLLD